MRKEALRSMVDIDFTDQDVHYGNEDDMPTISFSDRVKCILAKTMESTVIVKLLGRSIGYKALHSRIVSLWKPVADFQIVDLDNGYFLVTLDDPNDYVNALTKGPWTILGHYLTVEPWSPSFNVQNKVPISAMVWVRLTGMPLQYHHKSTLRAISSIIGELIDYKTESTQRGKFARLAIRVNVKILIWERAKKTFPLVK